MNRSLLRLLPGALSLTAALLALRSVQALSALEPATATSSSAQDQAAPQEPEAELELTFQLSRDDQGGAVVELVSGHGEIEEMELLGHVAALALEAGLISGGQG